MSKEGPHEVCARVFVWMDVFLSLGCTPKSAIAGSCASSVSSLLRTSQLFPKQLLDFHPIQFHYTFKYITCVFLLVPQHVNIKQV